MFCFVIIFYLQNDLNFKTFPERLSNLKDLTTEHPKYVLAQGRHSYSFLYLQIFASDFFIPL